MNKGRVVVAKLGLDGHTTGAAVVASGLRQAGFEVINLGTRVRPEEAVSVALQEDADVIGISILSGAHVYLTGRLLEELRQQHFDAAVVVGGTIPEGDAAEMRAMGAAAVFGPGSSLPSIVECVGRLVAERRLASQSQAVKA
jgi:methylmalonyl-CoA mutase C-terminal domain/subunit